MKLKIILPVTFLIYVFSFELAFCPARTKMDKKLFDVDTSRVEKIKENKVSQGSKGFARKRRRAFVASKKQAEKTDEEKFEDVRREYEKTKNELRKAEAKLEKETQDIKESGWSAKQRRRFSKMLGLETNEAKRKRMQENVVTTRQKAESLELQVEGFVRNKERKSLEEARKELEKEEEELRKDIAKLEERKRKEEFYRAEDKIEKAREVLTDARKEVAGLKEKGVEDFVLKDAEENVLKKENDLEEAITNIEKLENNEINRLFDIHFSADDKDEDVKVVYRIDKLRLSLAKRRGFSTYVELAMDESKKDKKKKEIERQERTIKRQKEEIEGRKKEAEKHSRMVEEYRIGLENKTYEELNSIKSELGFEIGKLKSRISKERNKENKNQMRKEGGGLLDRIKVIEFELIQRGKREEDRIFNEAIEQQKKGTSVRASFDRGPSELTRSESIKFGRPVAGGKARGTSKSLVVRRPSQTGKGLGLNIGKLQQNVLKQETEKEMAKQKGKKDKKQDVPTIPKRTISLERSAEDSVKNAIDLFNKGSLEEAREEIKRAKGALKGQGITEDEIDIRIAEMQLKFTGREVETKKEDYRELTKNERKKAFDGLSKDEQDFVMRLEKFMEEKRANKKPIEKTEIKKEVKPDDLFSQVRAGKTLKKVEGKDSKKVDTKPTLLEEIRLGKKLKKVGRKKKETEKEDVGFAASLQDVMMKKGAIVKAGKEPEEKREFEEDEWE